jgi:hypothetical protein
MGPELVRQSGGTATQAAALAGSGAFPVFRLKSFQVPEFPGFPN